MELTLDHCSDLLQAVTALSWHPLLAFLMAFGCDSGKVSLMQFGDQGNRSLTFAMKHPAPVISCCWLLPGLGKLSLIAVKNSMVSS